ncbi:MAG: thioredoxin family protein [Candidatus Sumerlaeaceae bacterium]|nr:thioredoxin family protein [Candidatus Sumerlaeaceae bacterium]
MKTGTGVTGTMDANTFGSGKTWAEYMQSITRHQEQFDRVYKSFLVTDEDVATFRSLAPLNIVAVGEDWCPDVFNSLGVIAQLADLVPGVELRIFERDTRTDIMDMFLTDGTKKRIPVFAFYNAHFRLLFWWAGRCKEGDEWVAAFRNGRTFDEIPEIDKARFRVEFDHRYDTIYRRAGLEEIKALLREHAPR